MLSPTGAADASAAVVVVADQVCPFAVGVVAED
jgi:hypothetical protein